MRADQVSSTQLNPMHPSRGPETRFMKRTQRLENLYDRYTQRHGTPAGCYFFERFSLNSFCAQATNALSAGDTCARLGKYKNKPGTFGV